MNTFNKLSLATAAAALFSVAAVPAAFAGEEGSSAVKCAGINSCKGQSACQTAESACAGHNACKGKGWVKVASADECTEKGGTVK